jgi:hypothetical protein
MSLIQLVDVTGATVGIETTQIQGITNAPPAIVPPSTFVHTITQNFVIPGSPAVVIGLLGGIDGSGIMYAVVKQSDATFLGRNAAAIAAGLALIDVAAGVTRVTLPAPGITPITGASVLCGPLGLGSGVTSLDTWLAQSIDITGADFAGAPSDVNFWICIIPTPT